MEDAVSTLDKYDFGLINDKNSIHLPRQDSENQGVIVIGLKLSPILGHSSAYLGKGCSGIKILTTVLLRMTECKP